MKAFEKPVVNVGFRVQCAMVLVVAAVAVLLLRLWYLQVLRGDYFHEISVSNRLKTLYVPPPRGLIFDRNGHVLVGNRPAFNVELAAESLPQAPEILSELSALTGVDKKTLGANLDRGRRRHYRFQTIPLLKDVSRNTVAKILSRQYRLPGISVNVIPARDYVYGAVAEHVLGYLGKISAEELKSPRYAGYHPEDVIGRYGIEAEWEQFLQGKRGVQQVVVNSLNIRIAEYSFDPELPGMNITLTLDRDAQLAADAALEGKKGAIVALDPNSGEVLAMASAPGFDPNIFAGEVPRSVWRELVGGRGRPMSNRAVQGGYPPGSVFKFIMAIAGLAENVIVPEETVYCPGFMRFGRRPFYCHKRSGHGAVDLRLAMMKSCDVYFYTLGQRLGIDRIHDYATRFGLGEKSGLRLVEEVRGIVPSTEWKRRYFKDPEQQRWYPGETPSVAIGQGALVVTPLQMANALAMLVNGGKLYVPYLEKKIESYDGTFLDTNFKPRVRRELNVDPAYLKLIVDTLSAVVNEQGGTGRRARLPEKFGFQAGGKTGTAQVVSLTADVEGEEFKDHAWFTGFAPVEDPQIVIAAVIENGGSGGVAAAPVVREVMEAFFSARD